MLKAMPISVHGIGAPVAAASAVVAAVEIMACFCGFDKWQPKNAAGSSRQMAREMMVYWSCRIALGSVIGLAPLGDLGEIEFCEEVFEV